MSKQCSKGHNNPDSAKFCRICGLQFIDNNADFEQRLVSHLRNLMLISNNYLNRLWDSIRHFFTRTEQSQNSGGVSVTTTDVFGTIGLKPISVVNIRFFNRFWFVVFILCLLFASSEYFLGVRDWKLYNLLYNQDIYVPSELLTVVVEGINLLLIVLSLWLIYTFGKKLVFSINSDYIEDCSFIEDNKRIAKNKKLGLFDEKKKKVRLWSRYDKIEKFDDEHLLIGRNWKIGIYRLKSHKIIIPARYTRIEPFSNSMTKATDGHITDHYDIKGNRLK